MSATATEAVEAIEAISLAPKIDEDAENETPLLREAMKRYDLLVKLLLIGDSGVGKVKKRDQNWFSFNFMVFLC